MTDSGETIREKVEKELSECCKARITTDYYGDPSVPGGAVWFPVCSKCYQPIEY